MLPTRVLIVSIFVASPCVSCGARDSVHPVEDDGGPAPTAPRGGFSTTNTEHTFEGPTSWDFGAPADGLSGKPCDPTDPAACGPDLLCCTVSRDVRVCVEPIRTDTCPKIPKGPSGGRSTDKDPGPRPSH